MRSACKTRWTRRIAWLALLTWWVSLAIVYVHVPPSPDQFELSYVGWRMHAGELPYRDVIDMNWPGTLWQHQLGVALGTFGSGDTGWVAGPIYSSRAIDYALMLIAMLITMRWLLREAAQHTGARWAAWAVGTAYPLLYIDPLWYWHAGQPDAAAGHVLLITLGAWWQLYAGDQDALTPRTRAWWCVLLGLGICAAALMKPVSAAAGPIFIVTGWLVSGRAGGVTRLIQQSIVSGGAAVIGLMLALCVLVWQGVPRVALMQCLWHYNATAQFIDRPDLSQVALLGIQQLADGAGLLTLAAVMSFIMITRCGSLSRPARAALPMLTAVGIVHYLVQHKGFYYHLGVFQSAVTVLALVGMGLALRIVCVHPSWGKQSCAAAAFCIVMTVFIAGKASHLGPTLTYALNHDTAQQYLQHFKAGDGLMLDEATRLADIVRATTHDGQHVFTWGDAAYINIASNRPMPTAFYYFRTLINTRTLDDGSTVPMAREWNDRFISELTHSQPALMVIYEAGLRKGITLRAPAALWVEQALRNYAPIASRGEVTVYRAEGRGGDPSALPNHEAR